MIRLLAPALLLVALFSGCSTSLDSPPSNDLTLTQALADLQSLHAPDGANPQQFAELKDALARTLQSSGTAKFTASAPKALSGDVADLTLTPQGGGQARLD